MPIVDVEIVGSSDVADVAQRLALQIGDALASPPGGTWVKVHWLTLAQYAENGGEPTPEPVIVTILQRHRLEGEPLRNAVASITDAVAEITRRPSSRVHIIFSESAVGRVAFGGKLVE